MKVLLEYSARTTITPNVFTFSFKVENDATINKVTVSWTGQTATGASASGSKTYTPLTSLFNSSFNVSNGLSASKPGSATITATGSNGKTDTKTVFWYGNAGSSGLSTGDAVGYLTVWGTGDTSSSNVRVYGYGNSDSVITSAEITWSGQNASGTFVSGQKLFHSVNQKNPSLAVDTNCSNKYSGSATIRMTANGVSKTANVTWKANSPSTPSKPSVSPTPQDTISIKELYIDKANSKGLKDNAYVVGSTLRISAVIQSSSPTKSARFILSGAKESDATVQTYGDTNISADATMEKPGQLTIKCIATNTKGNTATKTITVTIGGHDEVDYYGFYFFNTDLVTALLNKNISDITIKLHNVFNVDDNQVDPAGLTYNLYAHKYATYNSCKSRTDMLDQLTLIKTFIVPNIKKEPYIEIKLTAAEIEAIKGYKGIAFGMVSEGKLTIHNKQCYIDITYK